MLHTGILYLSRQTRPHAARAKDGTLTVTLLAIDRTPHIPQPYLLIWTGCQAYAFWMLHSDELTSGAELKVELHNVRVHTTAAPAVSMLLADVVALQVVAKAAKRSISRVSFSQPTPKEFSL